MNTPTPPSVPRFPHRNLPLLLLQARERIMARFRPLLKEHGLTEQQWRVLRALDDHDFLEPREIGETCCISSPSMAVMLGRMEELGLVHRERFAHDQRRVRVSLTARSRAIAARLAPQVEARYRALEEELGAETVGALYTALDGVLRSLKPSAPEGD